MNGATYAAQAETRSEAIRQSAPHGFPIPEINAGRSATTDA
jgi:hypothetical protein